MSLKLDELRAQLTRHCRLLGLVLATRFSNDLQLSDLLLANVNLHLQLSNLKLQSLFLQYICTFNRNLRQCFFSYLGVQAFNFHFQSCDLALVCCRLSNAIA